MRLVFGFLLFFFLCFSEVLWAQKSTLLQHRVQIEATQQPLSAILNEIARQGKFRLSYPSSSIPTDSLVTIHVVNLPIEEVLHQLLGDAYEYRQTYDFLVIRYAPKEMSFLLYESAGTPEDYRISGQMVDKLTGSGIAQVSIYDKQLMATTLTDSEGRFALRVKNVREVIGLTASKALYREVTTYFLPEVPVQIKKSSPSATNYAETPYDLIEGTWLGRHLIRPKQKIQSANLDGFMSRVPAQISAGPGWGTHGAFSGHSVNHLSINVTGNYNAGVRGMEIGFMFNLIKKDVRYFQFAGLFNLIGGRMEGMQVSGLFNHVMENSAGLQVSLGHNYTGGTFKGIQLGGLHNDVKGTFKGKQLSLGINRAQRDFSGLQVAGFSNVVYESFKGAQFSLLHNRLRTGGKGLQIGLINRSEQSFSGIQLAVLANTSTDMRGLQVAPLNILRGAKGTQIGFVNISDEAAAAHLGLINVVKGGLLRLETQFSEKINYQLAINSGQSRLFNQLSFGLNGGKQRAYAFGWGIGTERDLSLKWALQPLVQNQYLYLGTWNYLNLLHRLQLSSVYKVHPRLRLFGGIAFNAHYSDQPSAVAHYAYFRSSAAHRWCFSPGFQFGMSLF